MLLLLKLVYYSRDDNILQTSVYKVALIINGWNNSGAPGFTIEFLSAFM